MGRFPCGLLLAGILAVASPVRATDDPVSALAWLAGSWVQTEGGTTKEEHWMAPAGGVMLGMARTVRPGKPAGWEHLVILAEDGRAAYRAFPKGQPPATFPLVEGGPNRAVFANPAHDFPRKITYVRDGDRLTAEIEGPGDDGKPKTFRWDWKRAAGVDAR